MKQCKICGKELTEEINYCPNCGTSARKLLVEEFSVSSDELIRSIRKLIHEGNVRRIVIKNEEGQVLLEIPITLGVMGAILVPWMAALGVITALATRCTIIVERCET